MEGVIKRMVIDRRWLYGIVAAIAYSYDVINMVMFCLGMQERNGVRKLFFWGGLSVVTFIASIMFISTIYSNVSRYTLMMTIVVLSLVGMAILFSLPLKNKGSDVLYNVICFGLIALPKLFMGIVLGQTHGEDCFKNSMDKLSLLAVPASLYYVYGRLSGTIPGRELGFISYLVLAFTVLPFLVVKVDRLSRQKSSKKILDAIISLLFLTVILLSGTRSAYISLLMGLIVLIAIKRKNGMKMGFIVASVVVIIGFIWFNMSVYTFPGFEGINRIKPFLMQLLKGRIITDIAAYDNGYTTESIHRLADSLVVNGTGGLYLANRGTLYYLAVKEFLKSPLYGMGPMQFPIKYGTYPHNVYLEVLAEMGLIGFIPLIVITVTTMIKGWKLIEKSDKDGLMFVLAVCALTKSMMSGNIWTASSLYFFAGYYAAAPLTNSAFSRFISCEENGERVSLYG